MLVTFSPAGFEEAFVDLGIDVAESAEAPTYLVWYGSGYINVADLDDVLDLFDVETITSQRDGAVYRLRGEAEE